jgi:hypothetical protein
MINTVKVEKLLSPKIWAEKDVTGTVNIKMQYEEGDTPFTFVQVHYDYRYTSNAHQDVVTQKILELLGAGELNESDPEQ